MGLMALLAVSLSHVFGMGFMAADTIGNFSMLLVASGTGHSGVKALIFL
jgi:hypothetical protein